ncbi:MAG: YsnF/AvaK domain-containing protein [Acidobacteriaceae bacterium]
MNPLLNEWTNEPAAVTNAAGETQAAEKRVQAPGEPLTTVTEPMQEATSGIANDSRAGLSADSVTGPTVIPVFEETLSVAKRAVETAGVRVSRVTHDYQEQVDELLQHEKVEVERIAVDRPVEAMPSVRQEGDVTIIPVVEEVVKIERRLVLKEEIHIRRLKHTERYQETITLRRQEAVISRHPLERPAVTSAEASPKANNPREEIQ